MNRAEVLDTAKQHVTHDRQADHGRPEDTFPLIAELWTAYLGLGTISADNVAMMLALLKIARQRGNPQHADNYIDLAGYAACAAELAPSVVEHDRPPTLQEQEQQGWVLARFGDDRP